MHGINNVNFNVKRMRFFLLPLHTILMLRERPSDKGLKIKHFE
jgi:hypothetical protein